MSQQATNSVNINICVPQAPEGGWRPWDQAHEWAKSTGAKTLDQYKMYVFQHGQPADIPWDIPGVYGKTWQEYLGVPTKQATPGTPNRIHNQTRLWDMHASREWVITHLPMVHRVSRKAYRAWAMTDAKPDYIPADPFKSYGSALTKAGGWSWFLGNNNTYSHDRDFLSLDELQQWVAENLPHVTCTKEWQEWVRQHARPDFIPADPSKVYRPEFQQRGGWGWFLGSGRTSSRVKHKQRWSLEDQRDWVIKHVPEEFRQSKGTYGEWAKTNARPAYISADPAGAGNYEKFYAPDRGWGWFLGNGNTWSGYNQKMSLPEAREWVLTNIPPEGRCSKTAYQAWCGANAKPSSILVDPAHAFGDEWDQLGGWSWYLNTNHYWTHIRILGFLNSLRPLIHTLSTAELIAILQQKGLLAIADGKTGNSNALRLGKCIKDFLRAGNPEEAAKAVEAFQATGITEEATARSASEALEQQVLTSQEITKRDVLHSTSIAEYAGSIDELVAKGSLSPTDDLELIQFLVDNRVQRYWDWVLNGQPIMRDGKIGRRKNEAKTVQQIRNLQGGQYTLEIRDKFIDWYDGAQSIITPADYIYAPEGQLSPPNLMQRLTAYLLIKQRCFGNWSDVGSGKTLSAILASRIMGARVTVIFAHNSTVVDWIDHLGTAIYDDGIRRRAVRRSASQKKRKLREQYFKVSAQHQYIVINYEKFSHSSHWLNDLLAYIQEVDLIVLDEMQLVKLRQTSTESLRRQRVVQFIQQVRQVNPDVAVLGMSATPVINNLTEGKAQLEVITGKEYDDLKTEPTQANINKLHQKLLINGIRYCPRYPQKARVQRPVINCSKNKQVSKRLHRAAPHTDYLLRFEYELLRVKLRHLGKWLQPGTVIYTHYVKRGRVKGTVKMLEMIQTRVQQLGLTALTYTGENGITLNHANKEAFINGEADVLIASEPINTGVDGLQTRVDRLIILSVPWTGPGYKQLVGRFIRKGRTRGDLDVIIPRVIIRDPKIANDGNFWENRAEDLKFGGLQGKKVWYWDDVRWKKILYKLDLASAVIDGTPFGGPITDMGKLHQDAAESLDAFIQRAQDNQFNVVTRADLRVPLPEYLQQQLAGHYGDMSKEHAWFNTSNSETVHQEFKANPARWYHYHTLYQQARQNWDDIPYETIAKNPLLAQPGLRVADFGCGEALLAKTLPACQVQGFDHVAINQQVTACDLQAVPLADQSVDRVVCSLSLMSLNFADYLREAYRVLVVGGFLLVAESRERWYEQEMTGAIEDAGFALVGDAQLTERFVYQVAVRLR